MKPKFCTVTDMETDEAKTYKLGDTTMARGHLEVVCTNINDSMDKRYVPFSRAWEDGTMVFQEGEMHEFHLTEEAPE